MAATDRPAATGPMLAVGSRLVINDWLAHPELLPPRPCSFVEEKYTQLFALDVGGKPFHDQYVALAPNGVAVVGLAPSHPLIAEHRRATGYRTVPYKYTPADLSHLPAQELALAVGYDSDDGEAAEGADGVPAAAGQGPATAAEQGGTAAVAGAATAAAAAGDDPMQADDPTAAAAPPPPANTESKAEGRPSDTVGPGPGSAAAAGAGAAAEAADHSPFPSKALARVRFDGGGKDRSQTKLSGKKRGQGPHLHPTSVLARLEDADGRRSTPVLAVLTGTLLEVNQRLLTTPRLLLDRPCREGHIAIVFPSKAHLPQLKAGLVPLARYLELRGLTAEDLL